MAEDTKLAYHWLAADLRAQSGDEPPWTVGEQRTLEGEIALCRRGFHYSPSLFDGLRYRTGPVACLVEVSQLGPFKDDKGVARARRLLAAVNVERELRLFACQCAERVLHSERSKGESPTFAVGRRWRWRAAMPTAPQN